MVKNKEKLKNILKNKQKIFPLYKFTNLRFKFNLMSIIKFEKNKAVMS